MNSHGNKLQALVIGIVLSLGILLLQWSVTLTTSIYGKPAQVVLALNMDNNITEERSVKSEEYVSEKRHTVSFINEYLTNNHAVTEQRSFENGVTQKSSVKTLRMASRNVENFVTNRRIESIAMSLFGGITTEPQPPSSPGHTKPFTKVSTFTKPAKTTKRSSTIGRILSITLPENAMNITRKGKKIIKPKIKLVKYKSRVRFYRPTMSNRQKVIMRDLVEVFADCAFSNNLTFFMCGGTLLGSYRHHGMVPWDDDIDLYIPISQRSQLYGAFSELKPRYTLVKSGVRWKFFSNESTPTRDYPWAYPFIDVCFYYENTTALWDVDRGFPTKYIKSDVFPLISRPYWNLTLPAPKNTPGFLKRGGYNVEKCNTNIYNHRAQRRVGRRARVSVPCRLLFSVHPFVSRATTSSGTMVNETLYLGDRLISWTVVDLSPT